jgi:hypothetical protein
MKLSVIVTGRNDGFAEDFLDRLKKSITSNIKFFNKNNINFEYIIVDWFPLSEEKYLYKCDFLRELTNENIKHIVVNNSIALQEKLNKDIFYEYFAKNVGIRNSSGEYCLILNSDIIVPTALCKEVFDIIYHNKKEHFYRPAIRSNIKFTNYDTNELTVLSELPLRNSELSDDIVSGAYSGDWCLVERETLINVGQGYDETCSEHRNFNLWQTGMDAELLWNLHHKNITLKTLNTFYYHIDHGNSAKHISTGKKQVNGVYREGISYVNKNDWGLTKYSKQQVDDNIFIIQ